MIQSSNTPQELAVGVTSEGQFVPDRLEIFSSITGDRFYTYIKKNSDYGNSFGKSFEKWGLTAALVRMEDKFNRLESLSQKEDQKVVDESIEDTLLDLANYAVMTIVEMRMNQ